MQREQKVVRTYPHNYSKTTEYLERYLEQGYQVVMVNPFDCGDDQKGMEYIVEKEIEDAESI